VSVLQIDFHTDSRAETRMQGGARIVERPWIDRCEAEGTGRAEDVAATGWSRERRRFRLQFILDYPYHV